jgi:cysteine-rich repeat protein
MKTRVLALLLSTLVAVGCGQSSTVIVLTVTASPDVPSVDHVRVTLSNAGMSDVKVYPESTVKTPIAFPARLAIVVPASRSGIVDLALDGLDAATIVANGGGSVPITSGQRTSVSLALRRGPAACGNRATEPGEQCDDGNRISGDGCNFLCRNETVLEATHDATLDGTRPVQMAAPKSAP